MSETTETFTVDLSPVFNEVDRQLGAMKKQKRGPVYQAFYRWVTHRRLPISQVLLQNESIALALAQAIQQSTTRDSLP